MSLPRQNQLNHRIRSVKLLFVGAFCLALFRRTGARVGLEPMFPGDILAS